MNMDLWKKILIAAIGTPVALVLMFTVWAQTLPTAMVAGDELNATGIAFGSFFATGGLVWLIVSAGILIGVFYVVFDYFKGPKSHR